MSLRYLTAGESHGKCLTAILEGIPAGLNLTAEEINLELARRQQGYGRGLRMQSIEKDRVEITSGLRHGQTIGSPITLVIFNQDWASRKGDNLPPLSCPRPGHADLAGLIKYRRDDIRDILERASARETAIRVALGAVGKKLLKEFGIKIFSFVDNIGGISISNQSRRGLWEKIEQLENSVLRCPDRVAEKKMVKLIDRAQAAGNTVGGTFQVVIKGVPIGLGSHISGEKRLSARLTFALMSIPAVKGVEIGEGFALAAKLGSQAQDRIVYLPKEGLRRLTNHAGGIEGGISDGEEIILRAVMKPIASLGKPLNTVDLRSRKVAPAEKVRADVCAVPAAGVVGEALAALEIANAFQEKFGADSLPELKENYQNYLKYIKKRFS